MLGLGEIGCTPYLITERFPNREFLCCSAWELSRGQYLGISSVWANGLNVERVGPWNDTRRYLPPSVRLSAVSWPASEGHEQHSSCGLLPGLRWTCDYIGGIWITISTFLVIIIISICCNMSIRENISFHHEWWEVRSEADERGHVTVGMATQLSPFPSSDESTNKPPLLINTDQRHQHRPTTNTIASM